MSLIDMAKNEQTNNITVNGQTFTNNLGMPYETAIFNAYQSTLYTGGKPREGKVSTTSIIGPLKPLIYAITQPASEVLQDVSSLTASARGTSMHTGLESALTMLNSGYVVEQRVDREVNGWKVSGELDVLTPDKQIKDLKTTSAYTIDKLKGDMEHLNSDMSLYEMSQLTPTYYKYLMQLSIYKYLLNDEEVQPFGSILFMLNHGGFDGLPLNSETILPLLPNEATEEFLFERIGQLKQHIADGTLPDCTNVDRGFKPGEYKLSRFSPSTGKWRTVNGSKFSTLQELQAFQSVKGKTGDKQLITPPTYFLCEWCKAKDICEQYKASQV